MFPGPLITKSACCRVCGTPLHPDRTARITAHEYACYKKQPHLVPTLLQAEYESLLRWEHRSTSAKNGALTRGNKTRRGANR